MNTKMLARVIAVICALLSALSVVGADPSRQEAALWVISRGVWNLVAEKVK